MRKLHDGELHKLYSSPNIIRLTKARRMVWAGHVARMGEERKLYRVFTRKPAGMMPLGRPRRICGGCIQNESYDDWLGGCGVDLIGSGEWSVACCCEYGDYHSCSGAME
jgi:hypothetical protein